jgi:predicted Zn-ribbon and HTH transcriptional regulator
MLIYQVSSPNLANTVYIGSTGQTKDDREKQHLSKSNGCTSKLIVAAGGASLEVLETVTDPSVNLVDLESWYILKFRAEGYLVVNEYMPGAIARAGGIAAYHRQYRKDHPESRIASYTKSNSKRLLPLKCECCGDMSSKINLKKHQRTKRCKAASIVQPTTTTIVNNITATTVHIHNK